MTDVSITSTQLTSPWVFGNADADPDTGKFNVFNKAMARAAQMALTNDELIVATAKDIQTSTGKLKEINNALESPDINWMNSEVNAKLLLAQVKATQSDYVIPYDRVVLQVSGLPQGAYTNIAESTIETNWPPIKVAQGAPLTAPGLYEDSGSLYLMKDGTPYFVSRVSPMKAVQVGGQINHIPTDKELTEMKAVLQKGADKISQFNQTAQARLQEQVTKKTMWEGLLSTLIQLVGRMKGDIAAKF